MQTFLPYAIVYFSDIYKLVMMLRIIAIFIFIFLALIYSLANVVVLIIYNIQSLPYWTFWILNTLVLIYGVFSAIITNFIPSVRTNWISQEFFMNISMILIVFSNIFAFLLTLVNFGTQFHGSGLWGEENLVEMYKLRNIYILTFFAFLVNLPCYVAILYHSRMVHLHHRARGRER